MISEVTWFFRGYGGGTHVTKYQPDPRSHCSRRGQNSYAMSLHPLPIASCPRQKSQHYEANYRRAVRPLQAVNWNALLFIKTKHNSLQ